MMCFEVIVLIPRENCALMSVLCLQVSPTAAPGWTDTADDMNVQCIDIAALLDCDGKILKQTTRIYYTLK